MPLQIHCIASHYKWNKLNNWLKYFLQVLEKTMWLNNVTLWNRLINVWFYRLYFNLDLNYVLPMEYSKTEINDLLYMRKKFMLKVMSWRKISEIRLLFGLARSFCYKMEKCVKMCGASYTKNKCQLKLSSTLFLHDSKFITLKNLIFYQKLY